MKEENGIQLGDYVFVSRWSDGDLNDPWYIGFLKEMGEDKIGNFYRVEDGLNHHPYYRHCRKTTPEQAHIIFRLYDCGGRGLVDDIIGLEE